MEEFIYYDELIKNCFYGRVYVCYDELIIKYKSLCHDELIIN